MMAQFHNPQLHLHSCWILFWTIWLVLGLGLKITTYFGFMLQVLVYSWLAYVNRMLHCHVCQFGVFTLMDQVGYSHTVLLGVVRIILNGSDHSLSWSWRLRKLWQSCHLLQYAFQFVTNVLYVSCFGMPIHEKALGSHCTVSMIMNI